MTLEMVAYTPNLVDDSGMDAAMAEADAAEAYYYPVGEQVIPPCRAAHQQLVGYSAVFVASESLMWPSPWI